MEKFKVLTLSAVILFLSCFAGVGSGVGSGLEVLESRRLVLEPQEGFQAKLGTRERLREVYTATEGQRERTGRNDGPYVKECLREIGLPEGYMWCSAHVVRNFRRAGFTVPSYGRASSWFTPARTIYRAGQVSKPVESLGRGQLRHRNDPVVPALVGDLVGFTWGASRIVHVGFLDEDWDNGRASVYTNEGNTNLAGSRNGNGVWRNLRHKRMVYAIAKVIK